MTTSTTSIRIEEGYQNSARDIAAALASTNPSRCLAIVPESKSFGLSSGQVLIYRDEADQAELTASLAEVTPGLASIVMIVPAFGLTDDLRESMVALLSEGGHLYAITQVEAVTDPDPVEAADDN